MKPFSGWQLINGLIRKRPRLLQAVRDGGNIKISEVVVVALHDERGRLIAHHSSKNIVTTAGSLYYAQRGAAETPSNLFALMEIGTAGNFPVIGSDRSDMTSILSPAKSFEANYPKTNDLDSANTGKAVETVTYKGVWDPAEATHAAIDRVLITNATPGASEPLMSYGVFAGSVNKTAPNTLTVYINHTPVGV